MSELDLEGLARHLATFMCPDALVDAKDVGALLKCTPRHVLAWYAKAPGFPQAVRLTGPGGKEGQPRWVRRDITAWIASHGATPEPETSRVGRRRKVASW